MLDAPSDSPVLKDVFDITGTTLSGAFRVERVIAEGGFGVVYRAEHIAFRAPVALKCLKIPASMTSAQRDDFVESFREEAEMLFHLSAQIPEVVRPLHADAVRLNNGILMPFIAMEWVNGTPLDSLIVTREDRGEPPLGLPPALKMLMPIAHALHRAHHFDLEGGGTISIAHCDLKPENVIIVEQGRVSAKLLDFGIAKARELATSSLGRVTDSDGARPFTPGYGAPEQWLPKSYGTTGPWTDVWAMALTLVECLTGRPPIEGDIPAMMGTSLDPNRRPTPRNEGVNVSDAVESAFARALAVDPRQRTTSMAEFWTELEVACGLPSSFERAARRRGRRTFDQEDPAEPPDGTIESTGPAAGAFAREDVSVAKTVRSVRRPGESLVSSSAAQQTQELELELDLDGSATVPRVRSTPSPVQPAGASRRPEAPATTLPLTFDIADEPEPSRGRATASRGPGLATSGSRPPSAAVAARPERALGPTAQRSPLGRALAVFGVGLAIVLLDAGLTAVLKAPLALGPVRLRWLAALPAGTGLLMALASFATSDDD